MLTRRQFLVATTAAALLPAVTLPIPLQAEEKHGFIDVLLDDYPKQYMPLLEEVVLITRDIIDSDLFFEMNTDFLRREVASRYSHYLVASWRSANIYAYMITCNEVNNTSEVIDQNALRVDITLQVSRTPQMLAFEIEISNASWIKAHRLLSV